ncbi:ankyrin repeat and MYND domain-containing protein 1 isoform X2 [Sciurus carolinensis]|uniref:ankyrin repeat and MYND domain-containing protein 1 isoform X2 n=1 Tax=Sciurus carolinensis TaxID=30640 RepID=UPI001FB49226|nr:ankyrin repeat and MYND domain-containing protein 1 isoform X2 [Sciurus carolinensis]
MEVGDSSVPLDYAASKAYSSRGALEGQSGQSPAAKGQESLDSYSFFTERDGIVAPKEEGEESESPLREQDLKEAYIQLVHGVQEWPDGSVYRGEFGLNMKLGYGEFSWPTGETYHGQFYRDHCHGLGTYMWPDGSSFTGMFYLSHREGYGTMYMKTKLFQGLYTMDERFGPGVETYPDGSQDVGLWFRDQLIKLCTEVPSSFSLLNFPEFSIFLLRPRERIRLSEEEEVEWGPPEGQDPFFYEYKRFLLNDDLRLPPETHVYSTDSRHLPLTASFRRELDARIFANEIPPFIEDGEPWFIKNPTPLLVKMQTQTYKFRNKKAHSSWNMGAILEGRRDGFARSGPKERLSVEMILKAEEGDRDWIYGILKDDLAHPDVADATGYTVLAAAAAHCHIDVVSLLLDHGADVNKCTDEGLTPLSISFLLYYPSASFRPNVAERTLPQAPPKCPVTLSCFPDVNVESLHEASVPAQSLEEGSLSPGTRQSPESTGQQSSPPREESPSMQGSASDGDRELGEKAEAVDARTLSSEESKFQSMVCMYNYSIQLSREILEKSAQAYSTLQGPCLDKGTVRRMAQCIAKQRNRWLTIQLLLRRGADPNLCSVPMQVLFLAVKAGDVDGVRLLLEKGARTDIRYPPQLGSLTPLHIAAALPGQEGVRITELLLHAITYVDAKATDQDHMYKLSKLDLPPSSLKLNNEPGPPSTYYNMNTCVPEEGGRTALHVACEREDSKKSARDIVRLLLSHGANSNLLWSGHSPLSLSIASGNDLIVKELLSQGADPNLPLTRGLGSALCVVCDLAYEHQRSTDNKIALIDRLIDHGADILKPMTLTQGDKVAVGTAVDYGYFKFYQDRKIAHCPFHALTPTERETFLARKKLLEYMGVQLRRAVLARESQWDARELQLSKRAELAPSHRLKKRNSVVAKTPAKEVQEHLPFFKFCYQCGRSIGVRLSPCIRCYGILTCSKYCKARAWMEFHKKDCSDMMATVRMDSLQLTEDLQKQPKKVAFPKSKTLVLPGRRRCDSPTHTYQ